MRAKAIESKAVRREGFFCSGKWGLGEVDQYPAARST